MSLVLHFKKKKTICYLQVIVELIVNIWTTILFETLFFVWNTFKMKLDNSDTSSPEIFKIFARTCMKMSNVFRWYLSNRHLIVNLYQVLLFLLYTNFWIFPVVISFPIRNRNYRYYWNASSYILHTLQGNMTVAFAF